MRVMDTAINPFAQIPPWLVRRNQRIYELREQDGLTFTAIGKMYGMSHQRARQIWERECKAREAA